MKIMFNGEERQVIKPKMITPKRGQVWQYKNGELFTIYDVKKENGEILGVYLEDERRERHYSGLGWLNENNYTFVGNLF